MKRRAHRVRLRNLRPGLFWFGATLGFKSEYSSNENAAARGGGDAYVVESGEYFWGGTSAFAERGNLLVTPVPPLYFPANPDAGVRAISEQGNPPPAEPSISTPTQPVPAAKTESHNHSEKGT